MTVSAAQGLGGERALSVWITDEGTRRSVKLELTEKAARALHRSLGFSTGLWDIRDGQVATDGPRPDYMGTPEAHPEGTFRRDWIVAGKPLVRE